MSMNLEDWEGEVGYCAKLIETGGNSSVPSYLVREYLEMQADSAHRTGFSEAASAIDHLIIDWMGG